MRPSLTLGIIAALCFFLAVTPDDLLAQKSAKCLALLTDLTGDVFVTSPGQPASRRASWGTQLYSKEKVRIGANGTATVLFANNSLIELGPGSSITISEGITKSQSQGKVIQGVESSEIIDLSGLTMRSTSGGEMVALAGLRSGSTEKAIVPLAPRNSAIRSRSPSFSWQSGSHFDKYRVKLFGAGGLLWQIDTDTTACAYPQGKEQLAPGEEYFWQVEGLGLVQTESSGNVGFSLLADSSTEALAKREAELTRSLTDDPHRASHSFLLASLYLEFGLIQEAVTQLELIARQYSDGPTIYEMLGTLYNSIGLKDKAIQSLQLAIQRSQGTEKPQ
jgi:hypothetical protein